MISGNTKAQTATMIINSLQLITLVVGIGVVTLQIGRRDQALVYSERAIEDLRQITSDLVKTQLDNVANDRVQDERISSLWRRLEQLEK